MRAKRKIRRKGFKNSRIVFEVVKGWRKIKSLYEPCENEFRQRIINKWLTNG